MLCWVSHHGSAKTCQRRSTRYPSQSNKGLYTDGTFHTRGNMLKLSKNWFYNFSISVRELIIYSHKNQVILQDFRFSQKSCWRQSIIVPSCSGSNSPTRRTAWPCTLRHHHPSNVKNTHLSTPHHIPEDSNLCIIFITRWYRTILNVTLASYWGLPRFKS